MRATVNLSLVQYPASMKVFQDQVACRVHRDRDFQRRPHSSRQTATTAHARLQIIATMSRWLLNLLTDRRHSTVLDSGPRAFFAGFKAPEPYSHG
eukprot:scaffold250635_cov17-Prasinocladus_malaysianus.AAC.1